MKTLVGKFTFKVPDGHPQAGEKIEKAFEYSQTESESEAQQVLIDKKWNLKEVVDDILKANARSNAYQAALLPYRPSEVPQEDIVERMVRDFIRLGMPEELARKEVLSTLAKLSQNAQSSGE